MRKIVLAFLDAALVVGPTMQVAYAKSHRVRHGASQCRAYVVLLTRRGRAPIEAAKNNEA
jgi:hypothetical protein